MRRLMWCASALVLAAGCVPKTQVKPPYTGPTDSLAVVVGHLNDRNERIVSLRAEGDFSANLIDPQTKKATSGDGDGGSDFAGWTVCQVSELVGSDLDSNGSCTSSSAAGWCYVTGAAAGTCAQAIKFSDKGSPQTGARVSLQCIQQTGDTSGGSASADGGDGG